MPNFTNNHEKELKPWNENDDAFTFEENNTDELIQRMNDKEDEFLSGMALATFCPFDPPF